MLPSPNSYAALCSCAQHQQCDQFPTEQPPLKAIASQLQSFITSSSSSPSALSKALKISRIPLTSATPFTNQITQVGKTLRITPPLSTLNDDTFLLRQLTSFRSIINDYEGDTTLSFSVVFSSASSDVTIAVHFHPKSKSDTATCTLYDPSVDSSTSFLSMRGLQLHMLACFTRGGISTANSTLSSSSFSTTNSKMPSSSVITAVVIVTPDLATPSQLSYLTEQLETLRKKDKTEQIARKRAEIEQLKKKFEPQPDGVGDEEKENDENVVNFGEPSEPAAVPAATPAPAPAPALSWLNELEADASSTPAPVPILGSPSHSYNPSLYNPPNEDSYASFSSNVLTGSVAHDPLNTSINELSTLGNSIRSPSRNPALPTVVDTSPVQSPRRERRGGQFPLSESLLSTEGKLLKSMDDGSLDKYGLRAYELLRQHAVKKSPTAPVGDGGSEAPKSPMAKSLADFRDFTKKLDEEQSQFHNDISMEIAPPEIAPPSFNYEIGQSTVERNSYTPNKSSAMADYMMAKHMVESKAAERQQEEVEGEISRLESPFRERYSPTKASMMAEYKVSRQVVEMNSSITPAEEEEFEDYEDSPQHAHQTFITDPPPSRVSPTRESYSPSKASAMADYKVAKQAVDAAPEVDVSDSDIEALKAEMQDLRSQLNGVTSAVVTVAKELTGVRSVTQSLPSPSTQEYDSEEDIQDAGGEGDEGEEESGFLIQQALEREMAESMVRKSNESTLRASGGSLGSSLKSTVPRDDGIPPPPPTPPTQTTNVMQSIPDFDLRRSSLDMAAATRDLEEWGRDQPDGFSVKVTGMDLTIKNVRFPESINETVTEALNLPSPPRRAAQVKKEVETKVRTIEEKVKAVMMQAKKGGGVGKALGLSIDERGWKEGIGKGKRGGEVEESVDKSMDDTMFSPEAKTTQEREAKMLRRGMRKEEREARGERERRAMEERRQAFNAVFGKGAKEAGGRAAGIDMEGVTASRGGGFDVLLPPQPPADMSHVRRSKERAPLFPEDEDEEDFDPACLTLDNFVSTQRGAEKPPPSTVGSERMMELQARLPGSTFRGGIISKVEPPRVPTAEPSSPVIDNTGGLVMEMSPGFGGGLGGKGKRSIMMERVRERKMKEEDRRRKRIESRREEKDVKWEPPRQTHRENERGGKGGWRQGKVSTIPTARMVTSGNFKSVKNALLMVCLAGAHVTAERERAIQAVESVEKQGDGGRIVILLSKGATNLAYRGLYVVGADGERAKKLDGWGPRVLEAKSRVLKEFYRFNTGKKTFMELGNRTFGGTVDAVSLDPTELRKRGGV